MLSGKRGSSKSQVPASDASASGRDVIRYEKIAISLTAPAAESVRTAVREGRAPSVSAYVADAIEQKSSREDLIAMFDEGLKKTGGSATAAEQRWVDWWFGPRKGKPPRRPPSVAPMRLQKRQRNS